MKDFVIGFIKDEPDSLTPIDIVMEVCDLTYDEVTNSDSFECIDSDKYFDPLDDMDDPRTMGLNNG